MTESASRSSDSDPGFPAPVRVGETVASKYVIGRRIGIGGMGAVFEAQDTRLERRVAIKFLLPHLAASPIAAGRFKREAKSATCITSEHVVKVLEIDDLPDGTPMLVMEYLEGEDLRELLRESGPLPAELAVDYVMQALQAIAEGHHTSIIHRDLKPSNLFRSTRADGSSLIKVLDFGIAKTLHSEGPSDHALTSTDDIRLGSPTYMPPEQFEDPRNVDARSDFWALGVTLYELISGRVPFNGYSIPDLRSQVFNRAPDSLQILVPSSTVPLGLEQVIGKCLAKARADRYLTAADLATALAPFGSDDARVSRNRILGMGRPRSSAPLSPARDSMTPYQATLPVGGNERPHTDTSSGARPVLRIEPRRRTRIALATLGVGVALAGTLIFAASHWRAPSSVTSSLSPMKIAIPIVLPPPAGAEAIAITNATPPVAPASSGVAANAPPTKLAERPQRRERVPTESSARSPAPAASSAEREQPAPAAITSAEAGLPHLTPAAIRDDESKRKVQIDVDKGERK